MRVSVRRGPHAQPPGIFLAPFLPLKAALQRYRYLPFRRLPPWTALPTLRSVRPPRGFQRQDRQLEIAGLSVDGGDKSMRGVCFLPQLSFATKSVAVSNCIALLEELSLRRALQSLSRTTKETRTWLLSCRYVRQSRRRCGRRCGGRLPRALSPNSRRLSSSHPHRTPSKPTIKANKLPPAPPTMETPHSPLPTTPWTPNH